MMNEYLTSTISRSDLKARQFCQTKVKQRKIDKHAVKGLSEALAALIYLIIVEMKGCED